MPGRAIARHREKVRVAVRPSQKWADGIGKSWSNGSVYERARDWGRSENVGEDGFPVGSVPYCARPRLPARAYGESVSDDAGKNP